MNEKDFYEQAIDSDTKWYEEIKKLTTGQGEDYTNRCLLDYDYIKNGYKLIAAADPKAIQKIEFVGQFKNVDGINADWFILTILEKIRKKRLKFC